MAMLLVAAIGSPAQLFAAKVPTLPGSAQVATQAEGQAGFSFVGPQFVPAERPRASGSTRPIKDA
ncbi:hypothetical protein [Hyalangium minutum]|uniref:Uncharacterized protein n=1 Tax=Hyalangium minutum TaxID=394096 RepID=A0A085W4X4_9BACT|nr:hypothetical protein [Hyalangium minutum]KFE62737.1 hypothetical protein DB31_3851 [Hyalangium minutum]